MEFTFSKATLAIFSIFTICLSSVEATEWCQYEVGHVCHCFEGITASYYTILCDSAKSNSQLENSVRRILNAKPQDDTKHFHFYLKNVTKLDFLPKDIFKDAFITFILFMDVDLPKLGGPSENESPLNVLSDRLLEIQFIRARYLDSWEWEKVKLQKVETVHILECSFDVLRRAFSDAFPNMKELYVYDCDVKVVEPQAFAFPNKKLEGISFQETKLTSLSRESFRRPGWTENDRFENLLTLHFQHNEIESISADFLLGMEKLMFLGLEDNNLTSLSKDFFRPCAKSVWSCSLQRFYNSGNPFDKETCQYLVDTHQKYQEAVTIDVSLACLKLLGLYPENKK